MDGWMDGWKDGRENKKKETHSFAFITVATSTFSFLPCWLLAFSRFSMMGPKASEAAVGEVESAEKSPISAILAATCSGPNPFDASNAAPFERLHLTSEI